MQKGDKVNVPCEVTKVDGELLYLRLAKQPNSMRDVDLILSITDVDPASHSTTSSNLKDLFFKGAPIK